MKFFRTPFAAIALIGTLLLNSCSSDPNIRSAHQRGAVVGGGLGAIIGNNVSGIGQGEAMIAGAILGAIMSGNKMKQGVPIIRTKDPNRTYR